MIVLHSYRRCPFAIRVRMTLEEKRVPYRIVEENLSQPSSELLALHPEGRVPLLIDDGQVIYESRIITEYLDDQYPAIKLMPESPALRAELRLWTYWCDTIYKPDLDLYKYGFQKMSEQDEAELITRMEGHLTRLDIALVAGAFLLGDDLTLADIHLMPLFRQLMRATPTFPGFDRYLKLNEWLGRMMARPSFLAAMDKKPA